MSLHGIGSLHGIAGEVDQMARGFESLGAALEAVRRSLRDLSVEDTGPRRATATFDDALGRLEHGLGGISTQAGHAARVARRFSSPGETG